MNYDIVGIPIRDKEFSNEDGFSGAIVGLIFFYKYEFSSKILVHPLTKEYSLQ